jgi:hypothetical protein
MEGYNEQTSEVLRSDGVMPQKEIAASTGNAEIRAAPRALRAGVPEEGDRNLAGVDASRESAHARPSRQGFKGKAQVEGNRRQARGR